MRAYSNHFNILDLRECTADALGTDGAEIRTTLKSNTRPPSGAPSVLPMTTQPFIQTCKHSPIACYVSTSFPVAPHATVPYSNSRHSQRVDHSAAENLTLFVCHILPAPYLAHASLAYPPHPC